MARHVVCPGISQIDYDRFLDALYVDEVGLALAVTKRGARKDKGLEKSDPVNSLRIHARNKFQSAAIVGAGSAFASRCNISRAAFSGTSKRS